MSKVSFAEQAPLLHGSKAAINAEEGEYDSSSLLDPADSGRDIQQDIASTETATKKDIFLMICINFLSFVCFAIVLPSLWPFIETVCSTIIFFPRTHLNSSTTKKFDKPYAFVGWAV